MNLFKQQRNIPLIYHNFINRSHLGFTLIELLVVIAIVGMLSSIVLASLNGARSKAIDSSVKLNLANARAQATLFYEANSESYDKGTVTTDVCNTSGLVNGVKGVYALIQGASTAVAAGTVLTDGAETTTNAVCNSSATAWAAAVPLKGGGQWCVDSQGKSVSEPAANLLSPATVTACP